MENNTSKTNPRPITYDKAQAIVDQITTILANNGITDYLITYTFADAKMQKNRIVGTKQKDIIALCSTIYSTLAAVTKNDLPGLVCCNATLATLMAETAMGGGEQEIGRRVIDLNKKGKELN